VRAIPRRHKVWVITRSLEKEETEQYLLQHPDALPNVTVHYVEERYRNIDHPLGKITNFWRYQYWQRDAYRLGRILDAQIDFDLIHHVTGTGFREPGHLWKLGKPFVWGPIGGLQFIPLRLLGAVPWRSRPFFVLKNLSTFWAMHISRRPRRAASVAKAILAGSSNVAEKVRSLWNRDAIISCQVSAPDLEPRLPVRRGPKEPLRIVWSGNCDPLKALNIVLLALEKIKLSPIVWQLVVVGDGPLLGKWKALAGSLGLSERCSFLGRVSRAEALSVMGSGHCFVLSSLYEGTPTVVAEALARGLPVICLDLFGMRDAVNAECGIKIPPNALDQIIRDFAKAIEALGTDEDRRYEMAIAAQKASLRLAPKHKEEVINDVYCRVLQSMELAKLQKH